MELLGTSFADKLAFSLQVSLTSIVIVFALLVALMLIIKLQSFIINGATNKKKSSAKQPTVDRDAVLTEVARGAQVVDLNSDCELVAAIMAALAAHTGKSAGELNIRSIKRISGNNSNWRNASINK